jgi:hypothetical protein
VGVGSWVADVGDGGEGEDECCAGVGCCHVGDGQMDDGMEKSGKQLWYRQGWGYNGR